MFGMFGRRRGDEREQAADQPEQADRVQRSRKGNPQTAARGSETQPAPQAMPQAGPISARIAAEDLRRAQPADDLFDGVTEDDRFEIPAFLRRQSGT